jgi:hypothetical protein
MREELADVEDKLAARGLPSSSSCIRPAGAQRGEEENRIFTFDRRWSLIVPARLLHISLEHPPSPSSLLDCLQSEQSVSDQDQDEEDEEHMVAEALFDLANMASRMEREDGDRESHPRMSGSGGAGRRSRGGGGGADDDYDAGEAEDGGGRGRRGRRSRYGARGEVDYLAMANGLGGGAEEGADGGPAAAGAHHPRGRGGRTRGGRQHAAGHPHDSGHGRESSSPDPAQHHHQHGRAGGRGGTARGGAEAGRSGRGFEPAAGPSQQQQQRPQQQAAALAALQQQQAQLQQQLQAQQQQVRVRRAWRGVGETYQGSEIYYPTTPTRTPRSPLALLPPKSI